MDTLTYGIIIGVVFIIGVVLFTYFESPRETLSKGIKKLKNTKVLKLEKGKRTFIRIPFNEAVQKKSSDDINIYVHEY